MTYRTITIARDVQFAAQQTAAESRERFARQGTRVVNLLSSPGSGKTSLNGLARAKSSAVSSGLSSSATKGLVFFPIAFYLSGTGGSQRDRPQHVSPHGERQHI